MYVSRRAGIQTWNEAPRWILWRCQLPLTKINEHNASEKILVCAKSLAQCELCYVAGRPAGQPAQLIQFFQGFEHMPPKKSNIELNFNGYFFYKKYQNCKSFIQGTNFQFINAKQNFYCGWQGGEIRQ